LAHYSQQGIKNTSQTQGLIYDLTSTGNLALISRSTELSNHFGGGAHN